MKIIATIHRESSDALMTEILSSGADIVRINCAYGTPKESVAFFRKISSCARSLGRPVEFLLDLPGHKIRIGEFAAGSLAIEEKKSYALVSHARWAGASFEIPVNYSGIGTAVAVGQEVTIADGDVGLRIEKIVDEDHVLCVAMTSGTVYSSQSIHLGEVVDTCDHLACAKPHLTAFAEESPDYVAFSFVNSAAMAQDCASALAAQFHRTRPAFVAKIESPGGVASLEDILAYCDWAMVARGDLAVNIPYEQLGLVQKQISRVSHECGRKVIIATQLIESASRAFVPSRAEILDITNAILDGADALLLARETALSPFPGRAISTMRRIVTAVENTMESS